MGHEAEDIARLLAGFPEKIPSFSKYVEAYIVMRNSINPEYEPNRSKIQKLNSALMGVEANRVASWLGQQRTPEFNNYFLTARTFLR